MYRLILGLLALAAVACGTISVELDSRVSQAGDIAHDMDVTIEGPIVALAAMGAAMEGEDFTAEAIGLEELPEGCDADVSGDTIRLSCEDLAQEDLEDAADEGFGLRLEETETDDGTEYHISMPYVFEGLDPAADPEMIDFGDEVLEMTFSWDVTMPGEIIQDRSNADSYSKSTASFRSELGDGDTRETFEVTSIVRPESGGACAAPVAAQRQVDGLPD